jgi:hypothetical protein
VNRLQTLAQLASDLWRFSRESRRIAFFLLAVVLLAFGVVIVLTERSVLMPFIYTLF